MNQDPKFKIINFFFPPYSERELVSLFYLIFLSGIHQWKSILELAFLSGELFFFCVGAILFVVFVFYNAVSNRPITYWEKQSFALPFYIMLSIITIFSLLSPNSIIYGNRGVALVSSIELIILIYLLFKSFFRIIVMWFAPDQTSQYIANQMNDQQLGASELIMIVLFAPVLYLLLQANNSFAQVLCLSYFYLTTMINISSKVINKYSITR